MQANGRESNWLLVENEKNFDFLKNVEVILEPFSLELNNRKVKTKLYQEIKTIAQDYVFAEGLELHSHICNFLESILEKMPYPIKYSEEWDVLELLKAYGVELEEECGSMCEKLLHYIKLINQVCGVGVFIIVNIKQYLTEKQILELYKFALYNKIQLVLVEFALSNEKIGCEEYYIIDKEGCIISY